MVRERSFIISFRSEKKQYWDYFVICVALYNAIWTPFTVSFDYAIKMDAERIGFLIIQEVVLVIFVVDIIIQFMTSYLIVSSGEIVQKPSMIAVHYMTSFDFYIDFLSTFPFGQLGAIIPVLANSSGFTTFASITKILKVFRIRKIGSIITQLPADVQTKAFYKILYYAFAIIVILHTMACLLWFSLKSENLWVAPTDFGAIRSRQYDPYSQTDDTFIGYN